MTIYRSTLQGSVLSPPVALFWQQLQDLGSLLTFLQICRPLDNEDFYKRLLLRPLKNGEAAGVELLRVSFDIFHVKNIP